MTESIFSFSMIGKVSISDNERQPVLLNLCCIRLFERVAKNELLFRKLFQKLWLKPQNRFLDLCCCLLITIICILSVYNITARNYRMGFPLPSQTQDKCIFVGLYGMLSSLQCRCIMEARWIWNCCYLSIARINHLLCTYSDSQGIEKRLYSSMAWLSFFFLLKILNIFTV